MIQFIRNRYDDFLLEYIDVFPVNSQRWLLRRSHGVREVARTLNRFAVLYERDLSSKTNKGAQILHNLGFLQQDKPAWFLHWHLHDRETFEEWFGDLEVTASPKVPSGKPSLRTRIRIWLAS